MAIFLDQTFYRIRSVESSRWSETHVGSQTLRKKDGSRPILRERAQQLMTSRVLVEPLKSLSGKIHTLFSSFLFSFFFLIFLYLFSVSLIIPHQMYCIFFLFFYLFHLFLFIDHFLVLLMAPGQKVLLVPAPQKESRQFQGIEYGLCAWPCPIYFSWMLSFNPLNCPKSSV